MPVDRLELAARAMAATRVTEVLSRLDAWRGVLILTYHRIGHAEQSSLDRDVFSATPEDFETQMTTLAAHFDVIDLRDLDHPLSGRRGRAIALTFDDGYRDNFASALPVLERLGLPATFFLTAGFLDRPQLPWWDEIVWRIRDDEVAARTLTQELRLDLPTGSPSAASAALLDRYKRLPQADAEDLLERVREVAGRQGVSVDVDELWMTWDMVRALVAAGMSVGAHTMTHPVLTALGEGQQDEEIGRSIERVEQEVSRRPDLFAYPVGLPFTYDSVTRRSLARHGVRYAFAFNGGYVPGPDYDPYAIPRAGVSADMRLHRFRSLAALPGVFGRW